MQSSRQNPGVRALAGNWTWRLRRTKPFLQGLQDSLAHRAFGIRHWYLSGRSQDPWNLERLRTSATSGLRKQNSGWGPRTTRGSQGHGCPHVLGPPARRKDWGTPTTTVVARLHVHTQHSHPCSILRHSGEGHVRRHWPLPEPAAWAAQGNHTEPHRATRGWAPREGPHGLPDPPGPFSKK